MSRQRRYIFVGERPSPTAAQRGWSWEDGRACARTLHQALRLAGVEPELQRYCNLWSTPGLGRPTEEPDFTHVREAAALGYRVVALGALVSGALCLALIPHIKMRHPAARGAGRAREQYQCHVAASLRPGRKAS